MKVLLCTFSNRNSLELLLISDTISPPPPPSPTTLPYPSIDIDIALERGGTTRGTERERERESERTGGKAGGKGRELVQHTTPGPSQEVRMENEIYIFFFPARSDSQMMTKALEEAFMLTRFRPKLDQCAIQY